MARHSLKRRHGKAAEKRRAVAAIQVAIALVVLCGSAALAFDVGALYNTKADLQRTADSAALAAAATLGTGDIQEAQQIVESYIEANKVFGRSLDPAASADDWSATIEFGRSEFNEETSQYEFTESDDYPDSVRVRINYEAPLYFAQIFSKTSSGVAAEAIAMMVPRDISVVADLSGSHNYDSKLSNYKKTDINIYDVWTNMPGNASEAVSSQTDALGFTSAVNVVDNGDGTSTVTVEVTSDGSEDTAALSHLTIGMDEDAWALAASTATSGGGYPVETGVDPTTGLGGIKFDETSLGEDGAVETETFSFKVSNESLSTMTITVASKARNQWDGVDYALGGSSSPGPTFGRMDEWGTAEVVSGYDPTSDDGLLYYKYNVDWTDAELETMLYAQGYCESEVDALMDNQYDSSGGYAGRVAVALGLARWRSGHPGGLWQTLGEDAGNGNNWVSVDSEMTWLTSFYDRNDSQTCDVFKGYINYMKTNNAAVNANSSFKYRFGLKTFVDYLLDQRRSYSQTPELVGTPHQPMQAVRDAVSVLVDTLNDMESQDQLSLEVYGTDGRHEVDLTERDEAELNGYEKVRDTLNARQAAHYSAYTNIGAGIVSAINELESNRAQKTARKVIFLLTDGQANRSVTQTYEDEYGHEYWEYTMDLEAGTSGGTGDAKEYARLMAQEAANRNIKIYTVSVGSGADTNLMEEIAQIGGGAHLIADGSIEDYSSQLADIFYTLGGERPVELIK